MQKCSHCTFIKKHSYYKNLSPVTDADGIFRSRGGLFTQYRGYAEVLQKQSPESWKFPSLPVTGDRIFFLHIIYLKIIWFNVCDYECTLVL